MAIGVEVWATAPRDPGEVGRLLRPDEAERAAGFRDDGGRARFATGRALLRLAVAHRTGRPPLEVAFDARCPACGRPHGKPRLVPADPQLHTSVSHAGARVLVALAPVAVGVDVEVTGRVGFAGFDRVALTAAEQRALRRRPPAERDAARLRAWVAKEALLKLHEVGLDVEPAAVHVGLSAADRVMADPLRRGRRVALAGVPVDSAHRACVAVATDRRPVITLVTAGPLLAAAAAQARSATG